MRAIAYCLLILLLPWAAWAQAGEQGQLCRTAIAQAERERGLPPRLLAAIGRVESGRRNPQTGITHPWPWAINAEGRGSFFPDKAAAIAAVRALQAEGVRSIDIGCLQINLRHHPQAFATLEEAFDPLANARYGARFLSELQATRGDWMQAAGSYHSQTPGFAEPYRARVAAAWLAEQGMPAAPPAALPDGGRLPAAGRCWATGRSAPRCCRQPPAPAAGLDAYRAAPIPLAGRPPALPPRRS